MTAFWRPRLRVLITGATGFIGGRITAALLDAGHDVTCAVRHPERAKERFPEARFTGGDFTGDQAQDWIPRLDGIEAVVNAAGIIRPSGPQTFEALHRDGPIALFDAAAATRVRKIVQISALGADEQAKSRFHLSKKAADDHLAGLDLGWVILQPSIAIGPGGQSTKLFQSIAALPLIPLMGDGRQMIQPVAVDDIARAVVKLLDPSSPARVRLAAVGPRPLTFEEVLDIVRRRLGLGRARKIHIPMRMMELAAKLGDLFGGRSVTSENLDMIRRGNVADPEPFIRAVGFRPKTLEQALALTSDPQTALREARLSYLRPILRLSIAFIWIATGLVSMFFYPSALSFDLLARVGITGPLAPLVLYGTSAFEILLGLAILVGYRIRLVGWIQILLIVAFSTIIAFWLPEYWLEPFGPLTKNIPIVAATLVMMALEDGR